MHHWHGTHGTYGYRVQKNVAIWENHRSLNRSSHGFQQTIESIPMKDPSFIPGWWYTYPSEKMKVSQLGLLSFPTEWKDKKCSKPPTRSYGRGPFTSVLTQLEQLDIRWPMVIHLETKGAFLPWESNW
jgi:hypothetical protein